jgi:beta-alanine degradation protein BauB
MIESKVLLENDRVKVVEVRMSPGDKLPMHTHPAYVVFTMNHSKVKFTFPDGSSRIAELVKGRATYSDGITHEIENIGATDLLNLDIELK